MTDARTVPNPPRLRWAVYDDCDRSYVCIRQNDQISEFGLFLDGSDFDAHQLYPDQFGRPAVVADPIDLDALVDKLAEEVRDEAFDYKEWFGDIYNFHKAKAAIRKALEEAGI